MPQPPFDIAVSCYKQERNWPFVAWGLAQNLPALGQVFLVNDDLWTSEDEVAYREEAAKYPELAPRLVFLGHERNGRGFCRTFNQGIEACSTPYVVHLDGDILLLPGSVERAALRLGPNCLVSPLHHSTADVSEAVWGTPEQGPSIPILRSDYRLRMMLPRAAFWRSRGAYLLLHRHTHLNIGGLDEDLDRYPYMPHDRDYAMRWSAYHSEGHLRMSGAEALHLNDAVPGVLDPARQNAPGSVDVFLERVKLFLPRRYDEAVLVMKGAQ